MARATIKMIPLFQAQDKFQNITCCSRKSKNEVPLPDPKMDLPSPIPSAMSLKNTYKIVIRALK